MAGAPDRAARRFEALSAIVTGGTSGIGLAIARQLVSEGATVTVVARNAERAPGPKDELRFVAGDVAADADRVVDQVTGEAGHLDVLVNCAGWTPGARHLVEVTDAEWDAMERSNLRGTFAMTRAAARVMTPARTGSIVCVSSIGGRGWAKASNPAYAAMKGGVISFVQAAAVQLGRDGIRINAVCPGPTRTEPYVNAVRDLATTEGLSEQDAEAKFISRIGPALGQASEPDDVARLVLFLASRDAATITGQSVNVDGGLVFS